jgi:hypothetical protein
MDSICHELCADYLRQFGYYIFMISLGMGFLIITITQILYHIKFA